VKRRLAGLTLLLAVLGGIAAVVWLSRSSGHHAPSAVVATRTVAPHPSKHAPPAPRIVAGPHDNPVPILMYHVLGVPSASAPYPDLFVKPNDLAGQLAWLEAQGYHGVTLRQVFRYWRAGVALPRKPVVISFDDGYLSDYAVALPALRRYGWPGVLNLVVDNVRPGDITASQVRKLIAAGWEIDAHTVHHLDVTTLGASQLRQEVAGSRADLRRMFHQPVDFFCYPAGRYDATAIAAVRAAGYVGATTTNPGLGRPADAFTLNRIRIDYGDGVSGLATKLGKLHG
jgi:peptidoglycan/xylan/chitin deacetylase (PgdA/CDA1 family)